jgi:predicted nuclease with TOPRIM domain
MYLLKTKDEVFRKFQEFKTEAENLTDKKEWKEAMMEEYQSIIKNYVWEIAPRP